MILGDGSGGVAVQFKIESEAITVLEPVGRVANGLPILVDRFGIPALLVQLFAEVEVGPPGRPVVEDRPPDGHAVAVFRVALG